VRERSQQAATAERRAGRRAEEVNMAEPSLAHITSSFATMQASFRPERAAGVNKTIQFEFSGREPGAWVVTVANSALSYYQGATPHADARVAVDSDVWLAILRGEMTALDAVMSARLRIEGDMALMIQFQAWFDRPAGI
jgi:alkyl sulfatase BDS1-like metallo-beta-lactamase superfamily hydrolase